MLANTDDFPLTEPQDRPAASGVTGILMPGRNCCCVRPAGKAAVLIDGAEYFLHLDWALRQAARSVLIVGWDFDARITLLVDRNEGQSPSLGDLLRSLVESRPALEIRILVWNLATLHAPGATLPLLFGAKWQEHPRIQLRLDRQHPLYGAQHRKIVCIDGSISFVGGIDLTVERWDTASHPPHDPGRTSPGGKAYGPVHDLQIAVSGEAASAVASVAHHQWWLATGEKLTSVPARTDLWPPDLIPDFVDVPVAVARTAPAWGREREVREIETLTFDALSAARRSIYIEAQYFADSRIADILSASLRQDAGPEVVILVAKGAHGLLEHWIMGGNRDRMIRRLRRADRFDRFRAYYPVVSEPGDECEIRIHSKLMIVDDRFLRIGSSNLNRRSTGLDTECDLAIEASDLPTCARIAQIRERLLSEHLGAASQTFASVAAEGSLISAIDRLNTRHRRLRAFSDISEGGPTRLMPGTRLFDPKKPFALLSRVRGKR